jgi:DNA-binding transcriptional LysR family regulator
MMTLLDPVQLRSFLAASQTLNFTEAAQRLGLRQSTVSQHIQRLEASCGRRLFRRDTHRVRLTPDGEAMVGFARSILETAERAHRFFEGSQLRGRLRFGASDDVIDSGLPDILREFVRTHPQVDLELTIGLSGRLHQALDAGEIDLAIVKRRPGESHGRLVWRDRLVWIAGPDTDPDPAAPLPLILLAPPSITRIQALEALERDRRAWRITCTSSSQSGLRAAALAGLGVAPYTQGLIPRGLVEVKAALPVLDEVEFVLLGNLANARSPAAALATAILGNGDRLRRSDA